MRNNPSLSPSPEYDLSYLSKIWKSSFPLHREDFKSSFLFQRSVRHAGDLSPRCLFFLSPPGVGFVGSTKPLPRLLCPVPLQPGSRVGFLSHIHWLAAVFAVVVHGLAVRAVGAVSATLLPSSYEAAVSLELLRLSDCQSPLGRPFRSASPAQCGTLGLSIPCRLGLAWRAIPPPRLPTLTVSLWSVDSVLSATGLFTTEPPRLELGLHVAPWFPRPFLPLGKASTPLPRFSSELG